MIYKRKVTICLMKVHVKSATKWTYHNIYFIIYYLKRDYGIFWILCYIIKYLTFVAYNKFCEIIK